MSKIATRERILHAALEVFARKGYHRAVVDDIVRASDTSKGAVYHHFPNKEALFLALVDDFAARLPSRSPTPLRARMAPWLRSRPRSARGSKPLPGTVTSRACSCSRP